MTKLEAASIARVSVRTVERWIASGDVPAGGGRHSRRIRLVDLETFLAGHVSSALVAVTLALVVLGALCLVCCAGFEPVQDLTKFGGCPV